VDFSVDFVQRFVDSTELLDQVIEYPDPVLLIDVPDDERGVYGHPRRLGPCPLYLPQPQTPFCHSPFIVPEIGAYIVQEIAQDATADLLPGLV